MFKNIDKAFEDELQNDAWQQADLKNTNSSTKSIFRKIIMGIFFIIFSLFLIRKRSADETINDSNVNFRRKKMFPIFRRKRIFPIFSFSNASNVFNEDDTIWERNGWDYDGYYIHDEKVSSSFDDDDE